MLWTGAREAWGMEAPGPLVVARIPSAIVPVCVVSKCMLKRAHGVGERRCVKETACVRETPCVDEKPCVRKTACVRERYDREMTVGMRENETATDHPSVMVRCVLALWHAGVRALNGDEDCTRRGTKAE